MTLVLLKSADVSFSRDASCFASLCWSTGATSTLTCPGPLCFLCCVPTVAIIPDGSRSLLGGCLVWAAAHAESTRCLGETMMSAIQPRPVGLERRREAAAADVRGAEAGEPAGSGGGGGKMEG